MQSTYYYIVPLFILIWLFGYTKRVYRHHEGRTFRSKTNLKLRHKSDVISNNKEANKKKRLTLPASRQITHDKTITHTRRVPPRNPPISASTNRLSWENAGDYIRSLGAEQARAVKPRRGQMPLPKQSGVEGITNEVNIDPFACVSGATRVLLPRVPNSSILKCTSRGVKRSQDQRDTESSLQDPLLVSKRRKVELEQKHRIGIDGASERLYKVLYERKTSPKVCSLYYLLLAR
jgi:hypothetical protein